MRSLPLLALLFAACGDRPDPPPTTTPPPPPPALSPADSLHADRMARGLAVHQAVCAECHALDAPALTAPTLREITIRYHEAFLDPAEAIDHLAAYIREPALERSQLPKVMLDEWGVMPPQPLPDEDLQAAAWFIWHLPPPDTSSPR